MILTMQRTAAGSDPVYEWIAPGNQDEVTDAEWMPK
jgi:hypothetical protein